ncbi:MAG: hypothetical protein AAF587_38215 [Bacteroidota bacterium]
MKLFLFTPLFFFLSLFPGFDTSSPHSADTTIPLEEVVLDELVVNGPNCFPSVSLSHDANTPPGFCNTCSRPCKLCSGYEACRGVLVTATVNGSTSLPSGWNLQWQAPPNTLCYIADGTSLTPTFAFDVCKVPGNGQQYVTVTLVLLPPNCPPVVRNYTVSYAVC